jgi:hypothetical protein
MLGSDDDRDRVLALLREAYAAGRITVDELSDRVTRTLTARTVEELEAVVADLQPAGRLSRRSSPPGYWYPAYGRGTPRPYYGRRVPYMPFWMPFVLIGCFFWLPWTGAWFFFVLPFVFFGGFWLFALWRRALRF